MLLARRSGPSGDGAGRKPWMRRDARAEAAGEVQPVDAFLEERVAAGHRFVVAPVVGGLQPLGDGREVREHHVADDAVGEQLAQRDRQRLVVIVLADEHHAPGAIARVAHRLVVGHRRERRLLDQHVLAGGERLQRQIEMETAAAPRSTTASMVGSAIAAA